jgi:predicted transcriptional regulator of viral defense system
MSKMEALYETILRKRVLSFTEIVSLAGDVLGQPYDKSYINTKYVHRLVKDGRLKRIRRGLYVALSPIEDKPTVDKLLIASKIRKRYYLGYHTALEYHGCAYSHHNEAYICVNPKNRFSPFEFSQYRFKPVFVDDVETGILVKAYKSHKIRVSNKERTFLECLDRVEYAGGWEETLKSLENLGGLDFERVQRLVTRADKQILLRKTGVILELLQKWSLFYEHLPLSILEQLEGGVNGQPRYLIRDIPGPLNDRWRLYVPEGFEEKLRGV